jgi:glycosyltransferase involved in cell wall biosynthesis
MSRPAPRVSVVIPTHNGKEKVARCVRSVFNTSYPNIEVIVVNDCSEDGTAHRVRQLFPSVRIVRHESERLLSAPGTQVCSRQVVVSSSL